MSDEPPVILSMMDLHPTKTTIEVITATIEAVKDTHPNIVLYEEDARDLAQAIKHELHIGQRLASETSTCVLCGAVMEPDIDPDGAPCWSDENGGSYCPPVDNRTFPQWHYAKWEKDIADAMYRAGEP